MASIEVVRSFQHDMAGHPSRTWVVADDEADPGLPWCSIHRLGASAARRH